MVEGFDRESPFEVGLGGMVWRLVHGCVYER
jgi:hypothetical protein